MAKSKTKAKRLSEAEKALKRQQSRHKSLIRASFSNSGFSRISEFADQAFTYQGTTSDFDDLFVWSNVFVFCEYTVKESGHSDHLKKKNFLYEKILNDPGAFVKFVSEQVPAVNLAWNKIFDLSKLQVRIIYCTTVELSDDLKSEVASVKYLEQPTAMYFKALTDTIKFSARPEILSFLGVPFLDAGDNCLSTSGVTSETFKGSLLPNSHSHLGHQFKVISLYVSPEALLERAYVLRKEGWRYSDWLYQRMISPKKIEAIRQFLRSQKRVFLNNLIITLPSSTKVLDEEGNTVNAATIERAQPITVQVVKEANCIGLIDGQHRLFSYHEGGKFEEDIAPLRKKLNLLATGIMYPPDFSETDRMKFEAGIFLEINSNQSGAKSDLKQAITSILNPFAAESIARRVLNRLNRSGALAGVFTSHFYDKERLKTTSVVSYGIRHIVNLNGKQNLFDAWDNPNKGEVHSGKSTELLEDYTQFCFLSLNRWFLVVKERVGKDRWTYDKKAAGRILNTTNIIGLINYLRLLLSDGAKLEHSELTKAASVLETFNFAEFKSSQYGKMGEKLFEQYKKLP